MTPEIGTILLFVALGILALGLIKIFFTPLKFLLKLLLNTLLGFVGLILFNALGSYIGVTIGLNWISVLTVAFLGVPGLVVLLFVKWILGAP